MTGKEVEKYGLQSLDIAKYYGIKMGFGTDLFKNPSHYQNEEFLIRSEVLTNLEVIRRRLSLLVTNWIGPRMADEIPVGILARP